MSRRTLTPKQAQTIVRQVRQMTSLRDRDEMRRAGGFVEVLVVEGVDVQSVWGADEDDERRRHQEWLDDWNRTPRRERTGGDAEIVYLDPALLGGRGR